MAGKFTPPTVCPKCSGAMEAGIEFEQGLSQLGDEYVIEQKELVRAYWQKTEIAKNKFLGREYEGLRRLGPRLAVVTYRCTECGYLESYAEAGH